MESETVCSISTYAIGVNDIGEWNCEMQSKPFADVRSNIHIVLTWHC